MKHANRIIDRAFSYFRIGNNCAESVLLAIAKDALKINSDLIPRIATGFGGGISRRGYVCGAVSGAVMEILIIPVESARDIAHSVASIKVYRMKTLK